MTRKRHDNSSRLQGDVRLWSERHKAFAADQVQLLAAIDACGSISAAARQVGISYKTAWDRIDAINNMANEPVVLRSAGGARGGGTALTEFGRRIVEGFHALEEEHAAFLRRLSNKVHSLQDVADFMRIGSMKTSARNQYRGKVAAITPGAVNAEVALSISDEQSLVAIITEESRKQMGLEVGSEATALIKASWIILSKDPTAVTSARNRLVGTVARINEGAVNCDVVLDLGHSKSISAVVTNESLRELGLKQGDEACALFKASSVILMAEG